MGIFGGGSSERSPQDQVDLADLKARVTRLESTVARLQTQLQAQLAGSEAGSLEVGPDDTWLLQVRQLKAQGKMIEAIKEYRAHTGLGLKESKDAVDALY